jgi:phosphoribosylamine--glycine ligase
MAKERRHMRCLLLGQGGREAIMSESLADKHTLYSILSHENPTIADNIRKSGGSYTIGSPFDKEAVEHFMLSKNIELCVVNNDDLLEAGVIDLARKHGIPAFGPTREGARVEWSKEYSLSLMRELAPELTVAHKSIHSMDQLTDAYKDFSDCDFVVKPDGLTAGKGVKVEGVHFATKEEGFGYAKSCLECYGKVVIQEKIAGREFTIMGFTNGSEMVFAPATFDYPYRFDGDSGPGTGGMGCVSYSDGLLPFLSHDDIAVCQSAMKSIIARVNSQEMIFNGVLNGGFFKTKEGVKFMEFNARLGDPEAMNVLSVLENPFHEVVASICSGDPFGEANCRFKAANSYVIYVVSRDYAVRDTQSPITFDLDCHAITKQAKLYCSSMKMVSPGVFSSVGNSRLFALVGVGNSMHETKVQIDSLLREHIVHPDLDYRGDIGNVSSVV